MNANKTKIKSLTTAGFVILAVFLKLSDLNIGNGLYLPLFLFVFGQRNKDQLLTS